jgi:hypothetical protein
MEKNEIPDINPYIINCQENSMGKGKKKSSEVATEEF